MGRGLDSEADIGRTVKDMQKLEPDSESRWKMLYKTLFTRKIPKRHRRFIKRTKSLIYYGPHTITIKVDDNAKCHVYVSLLYKKPSKI